MITEQQYLEAKQTIEAYKSQLKIESLNNGDRWKCNYCGRDTFRQRDAHRCVGGFRKRGLTWTKIDGVKK